MENNSELINIWKSHETNGAIENKIEFLNTKNQIMDVLINFEKQEKQAKNMQIYCALLSLSMIVFFMIQIDISSSHLLGIIMIIISLSYAIISNRTDKFPDIRQLNTLDYLVTYKKYIVKRLKSHRINGLIALPLLIPGLYLTFRNSFPELGNWWIPIMYGSAMVGAFVVMKDDAKRSNSTKEHIDELIEELNRD